MKNLRLTAITALAVSLLATNAWGTSNLNLSKSNVNFYKEFPNAAAATASANLSGPGDIETVYTTPEVGDFVLTQFCGSPDAAGGVRLDAAGLGGIAQTTVTTSCYTFTPGLSMPANAELSCSIPAAVVSADIATTDVTYFCTISGMLNNKPKVLPKTP